MRIDTHDHVLPNSLSNLLARDRRYGATVTAGGVVSTSAKWALTRKPSQYDPETKLSELKALDIDGAVVSIQPALNFYDLEPSAGEEASRVSNEGMAEFCRGDSHRLHWLAEVPLASPSAAASVLRDARKAGCAGAQIGSSVAGKPLDDPELDLFWDEVSRLSVPLFMHPMYVATPAVDHFHLRNVVGQLTETTIAAETMICAGTLDRFPGVRVLLAHAGGFYPFQAGRLKHARGVRKELLAAPPDPWAYRGRLVVDTITHDDDALRYLVAKMGPENVLLGTDHPADMAVPDPIGQLRTCFDNDTVIRITETNPVEFFGLLT